MAQTSQLSKITACPKDPLELFQSLLSRLKYEYLTMNLATVDSEFGVLNRTIIYRGIIDDCIAFVTERNSRKYQNLQQNAKVGLTLLLPQLRTVEDGPLQTWQVRLIDAVAVELSAEQLPKLWEEDHLHAKIRSHIAECGKPIEHAQLQQQHDRLLQDYQSGRNPLKQTETFTAFKIIPQRWDFYMAEDDKVADRLQYRRQSSAGDGDATAQWQIMHIAP